MDYSSPKSSVHGDSPGKNTRVSYHALLQGYLPNPGIEPRSPTLQVDSLPAELPGKPQYLTLTSLIAQLVRNLPAMHETLVRFLGWKDPLEKG